MKPHGVFILSDESYRDIYGPDEIADIARRVELVSPPLSRDTLDAHSEALRSAEVLFSGWGGPVLDGPFLERVPRLKAVFYGSGSMAALLTDAVWERNLVVTSATAANAVPVAEFTLASVIFSLKQAFRLANQVRSERTFVRGGLIPGCYRRTVGIVSLGAVGLHLLERLRRLDLDVLVYDPFLTPDMARSLGVEHTTLQNLFERSDAVALTAPLLPETEGMITGDLLRSMRSYAAFINPARGELVCEAEMIAVAQSRPDLQFVLDVTAHEPPPRTSALYDLPNVFLTPHIAGSIGQECRRMGRYMVEELDRYLSGKPLNWTLTPELIARTSHRPIHARQPARQIAARA